MPQPNDLSRSLVALDQDSTIIAVVEMSQSSWLVAGMLPGIERQPRKKLEPSPERLLLWSAKERQCTGNCGHCDRRLPITGFAHKAAVVGDHCMGAVLAAR